jgi:signal transduction histidine kinase
MIPFTLRKAAEAALRKRASLSWAALALSLSCQAAAALIVGPPAAGPAILGMPAAFSVVLCLSVVLTLGMFLVPARRHFRTLLVPRVILLGVLLSLPSDSRSLDLVLTLPLILEIGISEPFPANLALSGSAVLMSAGIGLLLQSGAAAATLPPRPRFPQADWLVVSFLFSIAAALMIHYRETILDLEADRLRLDAAVGELARANLGYQQYAAVLEQRSMVEERKRITREIHDIIGYTLTNNIMMMEAAVEMVRRDPQGVSRLITEARRNAEEGLDGIRNALYLLRAQEDPQTAGIDPIERLVSNFHAATGVAVRLEYGNAHDSIHYQVEGVLFHIVQEALTNSFRHGRATLVEILFWKRDDGTLVVNIHDNGGGAVDIQEGIGVSGMRERLAPIGGALRLGMGPRGFTVTVEVPAQGRDP